MSAVNPLTSSTPPSAALAEKTAYEPSMEEILASIRRIIADDQSLPGKAAREAGPRETGSSASPVKRDLQRPAPIAEAPVSGPPVSEAPVSELSIAEPQTAAVSVADPAPRTATAPADHANHQDDPQTGSLSSELRPRPTMADAPRDSGMTHGSIAAPQFAMPDRAPVDQPQQQAPVRAAVEPPLPPKAASPAPLPVHSPERDAGNLPPSEQKIDKSVQHDLSHNTQVKAPAQTLGEAAGLFSASTDSAVSAAFNMLAASRLADNSDELMTLAREMIRPMLRVWIDDNMPSMVERMVRAEIERVARGGR